MTSAGFCSFANGSESLGAKSYEEGGRPGRGQALIWSRSMGALWSLCVPSSPRGARAHLGICRASLEPQEQHWSSDVGSPGRPWEAQAPGRCAAPCACEKAHGSRSARLGCTPLQLALLGMRPELLTHTEGLLTSQVLCLFANCGNHQHG